MPGADDVCLKPLVHMHMHVRMHDMHMHMCMCMYLCMSLRLLCTRLGARRGTLLPEGTSVQQAARFRTAQPSACSRRLSAQTDRPATVAATLALPALAPAAAARLLCAASQPLVLAGAQPRSRGGSRSRRGRRRWRPRARARPTAILRDPPPVMAATSCPRRLRSAAPFTQTHQHDAPPRQLKQPLTKNLTASPASQASPDVRGYCGRRFHVQPWHAFHVVPKLYFFSRGRNTA